MKNKILKSLLIFPLIICLIFSCFAINSFAASDTIVAFSKNSLNVGDSVTVTVTVKGKVLSGVDLTITYDADVLEYVSGGNSGGGGAIRIAAGISNPTSSQSYSINFKAIKAGSSLISVSGGVSDGEFPNVTDVTLGGASATLTVKDAALSSNANLKSLSLSAGTLTPKFSASKTEYAVAVKNSVTECKVYATATDNDAKVEISGESTLKIGKNVRTITVTAPSGAQKVYTVTINRSETDDEIVEETPPQDEPGIPETVIGEETYTIATDISGITLFKGFSAVSKNYFDQQVAVASDATGEFEIYYLKAPGSEEWLPYTFDAENDIFEKLIYFNQGEYTYILSSVPADKTLPDEYYATAATIGGVNVECYSNGNSTLTDFYYIYCYSDGRYGFYRYDSRENVIQRFPELSLVDVVATSDDVHTEPPTNMAERFNVLSSNAKLLVIALLLLAICVVALIILLIIKAFTRKNNENFDDEDDDSGLFVDDELESLDLNGFVDNGDPAEILDENETPSENADDEAEQSEDEEES